MKAIAFQTKLMSDTLHLLNVDKLIGKDVIITIVEVDEPIVNNGEKWSFIGSENSNGESDKINIRDFAHE